jgi:hypothetical protein
MSQVPGPTWTQQIRDSSGNRVFPDSVLRCIPMARKGHLQELARTVAFLLSADAG